MANNKNINQVIYGTSTLIDLTNDTVTPERMYKGIKAHMADGSTTTGTAEVTVENTRLIMPEGFIGLVSSTSDEHTPIPEAIVISKTITHDGTYYAASDNADGYNPIVVNVGGGGSGTNVWGEITGTLSDQTDLQNALNAKADTANLGDLATANNIDYTSNKLTNKPTLGALAAKDTVNYSTEVTNKPSLGNLASKDTVNYSTEVTNKPILGDLSELDSISYTSSYLTNKPILGDLSELNVISYTSNYLTNKPTLGTLSAKDDAPSDSKEYVRKNGAWVQSSGEGGSTTTTISWGDIEGTLSNQTDLQNALNAKVDSTTLGNLATQDTVSYSTQITDKPTLGSLASKNSVNWTTEINNIPSTFPPESHDHDDRYYTTTEINTALSAKAPLASPKFTGNPTAPTPFEYESSTTLANTKYVGDVSHNTVLPKIYAKNTSYLRGEYVIYQGVLYQLTGAMSSINGEYVSTPDPQSWSTIGNIVYAMKSDTYTKSEINTALAEKVNTSTLGTMATKDDAPSDSKEYIRKNGAWSERTKDSTSTTWGTITGTLSNQTDLQAALSTKADISSLGDFATLSSIDYTSNKITNKPTLGNLAALDVISYTSNYITNKPTLGDLSALNSISYTSNYITNKPTLGDLAALNSISYTSNYITNKPTLGTMAAKDDAASDNGYYVRRNGSWTTLPVYTGSVT